MTARTVPTDASVEAFLGNVEHPGRREDGFALRDLFAEETGLPPVMWGPSIVGYGHYRYTYDSGHSGEMFYAGFSPRKANISLYLAPKDSPFEPLVERLGNIRRSTACIYATRLSKLDEVVLRELVREVTRDAAARHG